jgi:hypothetical protein
VSRLFLRGERDVLEAADVDTVSLAFEPEGVGAAVELYSDVRPAGQRRDIRHLIRACHLNDGGRAGEARRVHHRMACEY